MQLTLCDVSLYSLYVDIIVYAQEVNTETVVAGQSVMVLPPSSIPGNIGPYHDTVQWYIAARYAYDYYAKWLASRDYQLGSGTVTTYSEATFTNQALDSGSMYVIYIRVVWTDITGVSVLFSRKLKVSMFNCMYLFPGTIRKDQQWRW